MCEITTGLRDFLLLNRQKTLFTTGSRAIAPTPTQRRNSSFAPTHQSETVNTTWTSTWITVVKSEGVGISDEKQGRPRIVSGLELDVHHSCRGWRRWFQFFRQRNIPIALILLLPFDPLFEHHDTSNSQLQIPHPDLSYPFLSVSWLIAASIHSSQSTWAPKTCSQWSAPVLFEIQDFSERSG